MEKNIEVELIKDDLDVQSSLSALNDSKGGKILVKSLIKDIIDGINEIASKHNNLTQQEFISIGAKIKTSIDMVQVLSGAESNKKYYEGLLEEELKKAE
jgi:hypothetical protein